MLVYWREVRKANFETKKRAAQGLPVDHDIRAMALYRVLTKIYRIQSAGSRTIIPDSLITYEAIRFALETIWPTSHALQALAEANPFRSFENEPIEGEAEDKELEEMLAKMGMMVEEEEADEEKPKEERNREGNEIDNWSDGGYDVEEHGISEAAVVLRHPEDNLRAEEISEGYTDVYGYDECNTTDWEDKKEYLNRHIVQDSRSSASCGQSAKRIGGNNDRTSAVKFARLSKTGPTIDGRRFVRWNVDDMSHRISSTNQEQLPLWQKNKHRSGNQRIVNQ
ncbi:hypothetical protein P879_09372 [Paragonimus westermani]|uniref:Uncharacterized protein n=1 Tax=Paragonimus westermani TaxID=34504 RepID=A0A8T0DBT4_9TREM|nr:hypothetical protein P879_09372 [Paragonimus westermani]